MSETGRGRTASNVIARLDPAVAEVFHLSPSSAPEVRRSAENEDHLL